jgi:acyl dehydratase
MAYTSVSELREAIGSVVGVSDWVDVPQSRIDGFAEATGDHQWIHTDPERAAAGPFGTTIAHGYLTLSLIPMLTEGLILVDGVRMGVNYGLNKVRFPAPVPVGSRVRASVTLLSVEDVAGGVQLVSQVTVEREGGDGGDGGVGDAVPDQKPVCVAETVSRIYF